MSEKRDVLLSIKLPVPLRILGQIITYLTKEFGTEIEMKQNGEHLEFTRTLTESTTVKK